MSDPPNSLQTTCCIGEVLWDAIPVKVKDTVGSGDAFLAAFIFGMDHFKTDRERLRFASLLGAFVATKQGANPPYSLDDIANFASERGISIDFV